tara:strand:+ start:2639 stop:3136 length:498 start_codon:yes stop_codon:yes gene_type:complete
MKKLLLLLSIPLFISSGHINTPSKPPPIIKLHDTTPLPAILHDSTNTLINALIHVESRGIDSAVGDTHLQSPSIGVLQIRPVMVREVNRILKLMGSTQRYKLKDRFDRQSSIEMFLFWKNYHHPEDGFEEIARCWNGGPRGLKNKRTEKYWVKVQKQLNKLNSHL